VPARKSLFGKQNHRGLPIGNLTSQFWANVYLNELDQFVKRNLRVRWYVRYVDDLCLLSSDPAEPERWRGAIAEFLRERLRISLRAEPAPPMPVGRGVDFVGWRTWWNRRLPRRQTLASLEARVGAFAGELIDCGGSGTATIDVGRACESGAVDALRSTLASYAGHLRHGCGRAAWERTWAKRPWLDALFGPST
jgi:hypothetical protein